VPYYLGGYIIWLKLLCLKQANPLEVKQKYTNYQKLLGIQSLRVCYALGKCLFSYGHWKIAIQSIADSHIDGIFYLVKTSSHW
jgi:hypothetical protein